MSANPWSVENIKEFWFLNCPECTFKTKIEKMFETHAFQNHPSSYALFGSNKGTSDEVDINERSRPVATVVFCEDDEM